MREVREERSRSIPDSVCPFANGNLALFLAEAGLYKSIFPARFLFLGEGFKECYKRPRNRFLWEGGMRGRGTRLPLFDLFSLCVVNFKKEGRLHQL